MVAAVLDPAAEIWRCEANPLYFVYNYCRIKDERTRRYVPFALWPAQIDVLKLLWVWRFVILLKARQLGMTTLVVCYAVWMALFRPGSTILIFSKTQREAKDMLKRIKVTIRGLPVWMQPSEFVTDATQELVLSNGSRFITFASRGPGGDSYTASLVIIDEADLIPNLNELLEGAEPTVAADGRMILLSRVNKKDPNSPFKQIYRGAVDRKNEYREMFVPWHARPGRTQEWYEAQKRTIESRTGALDDLYAQYPASPAEALAPRELDRRFLSKYLSKCFDAKEVIPLDRTPWPGLDGLRVYEVPKRGVSYVIGADVAEGNPNSDDSVACVVEQATQRQVAILSGKFEPGELAHWLARLAQWYNGARVLVERNHHGAHCIKGLLSVPSTIAPRPRLLVGRDNKYGWWTDYQGKRLMYSQLADSVRCCSCTIVDQQTYDQLLSLDTDELNAPEGQHDDCAIAYAIAIYACATPSRKPELTVLSYSRDEAPEQTPRPADAVVGAVRVEWFEPHSEWWVRAVRDGNRLDLFGTPDRAAADAAADAVNALLAVPGVVNGPLSSDAIAIEMYAKLRDSGWLRTA